MTWADALTAAKNSRLGGYSDWRLPNAKELQSIVDYSVYTPSINSAIFPNTPSSNFWSSAPFADLSGSAWYVDFYDGYVDYYYRSSALAVRLARGGQAFVSFDLSVAKSGTGSGTVTSNPTGIDCGTTCAANFPGLTSVTLTAAPTAGNVFTGWSGDCTGTSNTCTVNPATPKSVTATFTTVTTPFSLSISRVGSGTVTSSPSGIDCGATCSASFNSGMTVTLTAAPASGYSFSGWSGACTNSTGTCTVTMTAATNVTATFTSGTVISHTVTATTTGTGGGINPSSRSVAHGGTTSFTVTPQTNYVIGTVTGCNGSLKGNFFTTGAITADCAITATFKATNTATTITSVTPTTARVGDAVTVRFSVTGKGISVPGTGTVTIRDNAGASCTGTVTAGSCTLTFTSAGTRTLVASYAGNTTALASASTGFNLLVVEAPGVVTVTLPSGVAGIPYAMLLIADGGAPPAGVVPQYSYSATGLPPGFSFSKTGLLSGTASAGGSYTITVTATDALGQASTPRHYTLKILQFFR
ncbi:hypothetical protein CCP4SC76_5670002 [Gammaproteobacteria bacterium]